MAGSGDTGRTSDRASATAFRHDPLGFLDAAFPAAGDSFWLPGRQLCLIEPTAARKVLANADGLYADTSDFFHTGMGTFGPRSAQVEIGRAYRSRLREHLEAHGDELTSSVAELAPVSEWPDAGNRLLYRYFAPLLLGPETPPPLRRTIDEVVERAVLAGARERRSGLSRAVFRYRVARHLGREIDRRRAIGNGSEGGDLLDAVVAAAPTEATESELAEVFLSSLFAIAGSIGFTLGWSIYLLGTHPPTDAEPGWVVREALRLWPIAWLLGRRPTRVHEVAGVEVTPRDEVVVCTYLVHRHPDYWKEPKSFVPERWATVRDHRAFMPFGWGPHTCAAAAVSLQLTETILRLILDGHRMAVDPRDHRPHVGPALAPPRFVLELTACRPETQTRGGDRLGEDQACRHDGTRHPA